MKVSRVPYSKGPNEVVIRLSEPEARMLETQLNALNFKAQPIAMEPTSPVAQIINDLRKLFP